MLLMSIGNGESGDADGTFCNERGVLIFERLQAADAATHEHAETVAIHFIEIDPGIAHRAFRRRHREMGKAIGPLVFLGIIENRLGIEVANLARDRAVKPAGIEARDLDDAAFALEQVLPIGLQLHA